MANANFNPEEANHKYKLKVIDVDAELKLKRLQAGWIGVVFGTENNASMNLAGITLCAVLLVGLVSSFMGNNAIEMWKVVAPIITLVVGYIFGKRSKKIST